MTTPRRPPDSAGRVSSVEDGFCPTCEVTLDLHDTKDGEDEFDCQIAGQKADLLTQFGGLFGGR